IALDCPAGSPEPTVDVINVPAGTYTLSLGGFGDDAGGAGDLDIIGSLDIVGAGAGTTIIDGNGIDRVFHIMVNGPVSMSGLTITGGGHAVGNPGAGIYVEFGQLTGTSIVVTENDAGSSILTSGGGGVLVGPTAALTLMSSVVSNNSAGRGAGVFADGNSVSSPDVELITTTLSGNTAVSESGSTTGGGIWMQLADVTLDRSTVTGNTATNGGGIFNQPLATGELTVLNSTISGNTATGGGGGIEMAGTETFGGGNAVVRFSTITDNTAPEGRGAGIDAAFATVELFASIVANNTGVECMVFAGGTFDSLGSNIDSDSTCGLDQTTDQPNTDPMLAALASNGGPTLTHALMEGSPAIDAVVEATPACPATDQRAVARPQDGDGDGTSACDTGAFEAAAAVAEPTEEPTAAPTATPTAAPTATPTAAPTATPTAAPSPTSTPTPSPTPTPTPTSPSPSGVLSGGSSPVSDELPDTAAPTVGGLLSWLSIALIAAAAGVQRMVARSRVARR
ncbi:MAG TPA: choice-of-anchor Q domain-containing protein, partial [Acidimicrobiia bacterium]|nr:choice-of-anchor Q domain-containing protein [Acidimicrobiia bacterium]